MSSSPDPREAEAERRAKALMAQGYSWSRAVTEAMTAPLPETPARPPAQAPPSAVRTPSSSTFRSSGLRLDWEDKARAKAQRSVDQAHAEDERADFADEDEDFVMESVTGRSFVSNQPRFDQRIANAPALPKPPMFSGSTRDDRRKHAQAYKTYVRSLKAYETSQMKPYVMPISHTIEESTRLRIAYYRFRKNADQITESEWAAYFDEAETIDVKDFKAVDAAMTKLKMDIRLRDAESRVDKLVADMHVVLKEYRVEKLMADGENMRLVEYLVAALEPAEFKEVIVGRLKQERNKKYKKSVVLFADWCTVAMDAWMVWEPARDSKTVKQSQPSRSSGPMTTPSSSASAKNPKSGGGAAVASPAASSGAPSGGKTLSPCLKCQSTEHSVKQHPGITPEEATRLIAEWRASRRPAKVARLQIPRVDTLSCVEHGVDDASGAVLRDCGTARAVVDELVELDALLDTGADVSIVSKGVVDKLVATGQFLTIASEPAGKKLDPLGGEEIVVTRKISLRKLTLATSAGPLVLERIQCWIHEEDEKLHLILGRPLMNVLGYTTDGLLKSALRRLGAVPIGSNEDEPEASTKPVEEEKTREDVEEGAVSALKVNQLKIDAVAEDESGDMIERMALPDPTPSSMERVREVLQERHAAAVAAGLPEDAAAYLKETLRLYDSIFRLALGCDPPVKIAPLKVRMKPGVQPTKCAARKMSPIFTDYVIKHVKELVAAGCLKRNNRSRWSSPPRVVPKGTAGDLRMVVDVRGVNERTDPMPWPMPYVDVLLMYLLQAICFFILDADKMFWQLPLHEDSQELFTIMTVLGMMSPTRVLMGQTDAPAFAQATMEEIFADMLNQEVLVWIDDVLGHASSPMQLMVVLRKAFTQCEKYGLKLNPKKCNFYATEIKWCGRMLSANGVTHCPERIAGLVGLPAPMTAADLQQFVCAVNWMRASIPSYSELVAPLQKLLEVAAKRAGTRKKIALKRVDLLHGLWTDEHDKAFGAIKTALEMIAPLAHPSPEATVCVFTDASLDHWGATVTQLVPGNDDVPITEREHKPLAFLSGSFVDAASRWPIVEKEAFAIVETCKRLEYLLRREKGFRLYTDHRNLVYIFDPYASDSAMPRYQADKLQRWSTVMMMFKYEIYHVAGDANVWGDLLSRWGARVDDRVVQVRTLAAVDMNVSPLPDPTFLWPTLEQVHEAQQLNLRARDADQGLPDVQWSEEDRVYKNGRGQVWVPDDAVDLQQRLCVVAHAGAAGHRGKAVTRQVIQERFYWSTMAGDVSTFVKSCLHCLSVRGEKVPRPYGPTLHATRPNEVLHFDFLSMPLGNGKSKYVLVLKDDMSNFVELIECEAADSEAVVRALMGWFKRYGIVSVWVSDQGSHFKNMTIEDLCRLLGSQQNFVTAHCPWANGTVEVVNRLVLKVIRSLLSELKLAPEEWPSLLPVVQAALNNLPSDKLGGVAPLTAFTQLPASTPLSVLFHPTTKDCVTVEWVQQEQRKHLQEAADALEAMHRQLSTEAEQKRAAARARQKNKRGVEPASFDVGDFVLVGQVTTHANKLALRWRGPRRITRVIHDYIFEVQNLVAPFEKSVHHSSRLRWYAEASREVTTALEDHVRHTEGGHLVEKFLEARMGPDTHQPEVHVKWIGLEEEESTWELAAELFKDVPVLMRRYAPKIKDNVARKAIEELLAQDQPRGAKPAAADKEKQTKTSGKRKAKTKRSTTTRSTA